jgi:hypothetical protein
MRMEKYLAAITVTVLIAGSLLQPVFAQGDYKTSSGYPTAGTYPTSKGYPTKSSPTAHNYFTRQSPTAKQWQGDHMKQPKKFGMPHLNPLHADKMKTRQANVQSGTAGAKKFPMHRSPTATSESTAMAAGNKSGGFHVPFFHTKNSTANNQSSSMAAGNKSAFHLPGHQKTVATDDLQSAILKQENKSEKKPFQFPIFHKNNTTATSASSDMAKSNKGPFHWPGQKSTNSSASADSTKMAVAKQKKSWFHLPSLKKSNDGSLGAGPGVAPNNNSL